MTEELEILRDYLHAENPALDTLEGVVADIVLKDRSARDILIKLCIRTGVLQSFILEGEHDLLFISHCKTKLVNDHFFSETAAGKAIAYCKFLTQKEVKLVPFQIDGKWGFQDKLGKEIISCEYETVGYEFHEGLVEVKFNGKYGFIDMSGNEIIAFNYEDAVGFQEGLAGVNRNGKWGYIDRTGKLIIGYSYNEVWSFSEGIAAVTGQTHLN